MIHSLLIAVPATVVDTVTVTGANTAFALPSRSCVLAWQTSFNEDPDDFDADFEVSMDIDGPWTVLDTSTSVTSEFRTIADPTAALFGRINVNTNTGGKELTVQVVAKVAVP